MTNTKRVLYSLLAFILLIIFIFGMSMLDLGFKKFFKPKHANVERETYEQTKSYVHGSIKEIADLYQQYREAETPEERAIIQTTIQSKFSAFDATTISSSKLRNFLIQTRGY